MLLFSLNNELKRLILIFNFKCLSSSSSLSDKSLSFLFFILSAFRFIPASLIVVPRANATIESVVSLRLPRETWPDSLTPLSQNWELLGNAVSRCTKKVRSFPSAELS